MRIALVGYGKMGKTINCIAKERGHTIDLIVDRDNQEDLTAEKLREIDIVIEFTSPQSALNNYIKCFSFGIPVVSGTTGWLENRNIIEEYCKKGSRFFYASNFSLGVNLFFQINKYVAKLLAPYDNYKTEIEEIHHTQKLDAPSGTAITIAEGILENSPKLIKWENSITNKEDILPIISKRIGEVPGTHTVSYSSQEDVLSIRHTAKGREGFALGAVIAAEFLLKQERGWYEMKDLLKL